MSEYTRDEGENQFDDNYWGVDDYDLEENNDHDKNILELSKEKGSNIDEENSSGSHIRRNKSNNNKSFVPVIVYLPDDYDPNTDSVILYQSKLFPGKKVSSMNDLVYITEIKGTGYWNFKFTSDSSSADIYYGVKSKKGKINFIGVERILGDTKLIFKQSPYSALSEWQKEHLDNVKKVKSLTIQKIYDDQLPILWSVIRSKMKSRDENLNVVINWKDIKENDKVFPSVERSLKRWKDLKEKLNDKKFDPVHDNLSITNLKHSIAEEKSDLESMKTANRLFYTTANMEELIVAIDQFIKKRSERKDENFQFHRFDNYFIQSKMQAILSVYNILTPSDIKALTAQETGDFTYTEVAGISSGKSGHVNPLKPKFPDTYTGIGQVGMPAKKEGVSWAEKHGINIPKQKGNQDTRDIPMFAVLITAAYLSHIIENLKSIYGSRLPESSLEMKKIVFAVYNWRLSAFKTMIEKQFGSNEEIKFENFQKHLPSETQNYVNNIMKRLGN